MPYSNFLIMKHSDERLELLMSISGGWNRHIRSVVAQIWSYDIIIEYWKHLYDIMT